VVPATLRPVRTDSGSTGWSALQAPSAGRSRCPRRPPRRWCMPASRTACSRSWCPNSHQRPRVGSRCIPCPSRWLTYTSRTDHAGDVLDQGVAAFGGPTEGQTARSRPASSAYGKSMTGSTTRRTASVGCCWSSGSSKCDCRWEQGWHGSPLDTSVVPDSDCAPLSLWRPGLTGGRPWPIHSAQAESVATTSPAVRELWEARAPGSTTATGHQQPEPE
jgi:hypothetical protein